MTRTDKTTCYVCGNVITGEPVNVGQGAKQMTGLFRHRRCAPGGSKWMHIQAAKPRKERSELFDYYLEAAGGVLPPIESGEGGSV